MDKLLSTVQKGGESVRDFIERFSNLFFVPQVWFYLYCFRHVGITFSTKWKSAWELSRHIACRTSRNCWAIN